MDDPTDEGPGFAVPEEASTEEKAATLGKIGFAMSFAPWAVLLLMALLRPG